MKDAKGKTPQSVCCPQRPSDRDLASVKTKLIKKKKGGDYERERVSSGKRESIR